MARRQLVERDSARRALPGNRDLAGQFGTDAATISSSGIPAVVFGPGDIAQAHTNDEWIDLEELEQAGEILFRLANSAE